MRRDNSRRDGFTLVELMITVAIIGVLAALAIYGVRRYLASATAAEAKQMVGSIARGAVAAFEREQAAAELPGEGVSGAKAKSGQLCASAEPVPASLAQVKAKKYQPSSAAKTDFQTGDELSGWQCLQFVISQPIYYRYSYYQGGNYVANNNPAKPDATGFEAGAQGDLDGDTQPSTFARTGQVDAKSGALRVATQVYAESEEE